jgi:large subunit ribosomal protein L25
MQTTFEVNAEPRSDQGKGASRRLRRTGVVPGIVYGAAQDAQRISLKHDEFMHQLQNEAFFSHILTLKLGGESVKVVLKDLQRHPFRPIILHADFLRIDENKEITMRVPIHFINEGICDGVRNGGGVISHIMNEVEVSCLPRHLPEFITVDMEHIALNQTVHLSDLGMPEGVTNYALKHGGDPTRPVVNVHIPREIVVEEVAPVEAVVVPEGEAAAAAAAAPGTAPAAPGAAPPAAGAAAPGAAPAADKDKAKAKGKDKGKG